MAALKDFLCPRLVYSAVLGVYASDRLTIRKLTATNQNIYGFAFHQRRQGKIARVALGCIKTGDSKRVKSAIG